MTTVQDRELSIYDSQPVELYKFMRGETRKWLFTSDADPFVALDGTYIPAVINRNDPSTDTKHSGLELDVPWDFPIAALFQTGAPGSPIWLTVTSAQRGLTDTETIWQGKVRGLSSKGSRLKIQCDPMDKVLTRSTLRRTFAVQCGLDLYSTKCGVNEDLWTFDATITALSPDGLSLTAATFATQPDGTWKGGEIYHPELDVRRQITGHTGSVVTLAVAIPGLVVGDAIKLLRGCDHCWKRADGSDGDCIAVFNNALNYGGWPWHPDTNPFEYGIE